MTTPISATQVKFWTQMFSGLCLYLALELGLFVIAQRLLHTTYRELEGPYLAFVAPGVIIVLLAWRLRMWEERATSPKRLALGWGLSGALFFFVTAVAFLYSGVKLHLLNPSDAAIFIVAGVAGVLTSSFSLYYKALSSISARTTKKKDEAPT